MDAKLKVLVLNKFFPLTMGHYFIRALERRNDIDLKTCGPFSGSWIPWKGGMNVPDKYVYTPDIVLSYPMDWQAADYDLVKTYLGDWKPDLIINTSSTLYWRNKPSDGYSAAIAIDPHVLDYDHVRKVSDKFFNMQWVYSKDGDEYLPYAYDPTVHYEDESVEKIYDIAMVGLEYPHRMNLAEKLRQMGLKVYINTGEIFDDYRKVNSQSRIVLNWSTLDDLNARAFEAPMMGVPVMNYVTDMDKFPFFLDNVNLFNCDNNAQDKSSYVRSAVYAISDVLDDYETEKILKDTREKMKPHTYDARISQLLKSCGFGE